MEKTLSAVVGLLNLDTDTLKDSAGKWLPDDALAAELQKQAAERIAALKTEQYGRGQRVTNKAMIAQMKAHGFENPDGLKDAELYAAFAEHLASKSGGDGKKDWDEATAKKDPVVAALLRNSISGLQAKNLEIQTAFDTYRKTEGLKIAKTIAQAKAREILEKNGAVLETPQVKKDARLAQFYRLLDWDEIEVNESGEVVLSKEGQPKTDDFGKPVTFESYVKGLNDNLFGWQKQDPNKGGGNPGGGKPSGGNGAAMNFADEKAFNDYMRTATGPERLAAAKAWVEGAAN